MSTYDLENKTIHQVATAFAKVGKQAENYVDVRLGPARACVCVSRAKARIQDFWQEYLGISSIEVEEAHRRKGKFLELCLLLARVATRMRRHLCITEVRSARLMRILLDHDRCWKPYAWVSTADDLFDIQGPPESFVLVEESVEKLGITDRLDVLWRRSIMSMLPGTFVETPSDVAKWMKYVDELFAFVLYNKRNRSDEDVGMVDMDVKRSDYHKNEKIRQVMRMYPRNPLTDAIISADSFLLRIRLHVDDDMMSEINKGEIVMTMPLDPLEMFAPDKWRKMIRHDYATFTHAPKGDGCQRCLHVKAEQAVRCQRCKLRVYCSQGCRTRGKTEHRETCIPARVTVETTTDKFKSPKALHRFTAKTGDAHNAAQNQEALQEFAEKPLFAVTGRVGLCVPRPLAGVVPATWMEDADGLIYDVLDPVLFQRATSLGKRIQTQDLIKGLLVPGLTREELAEAGVLYVADK